MPTIIIEDTLKKGAFRDSIDILVDGLSRGHFHSTGHTEIRVTTGEHTVRLRINNRELLPAKAFHLSEREIITFECAKIGFWRPELKLDEQCKKIGPEEVSHPHRADSASSSEPDPLKIYGEIHRRHRNF